MWRVRASVLPLGESVYIKNKLITCEGCIQIWCPGRQNSLNVRDQNLDCWNVCFILKVSYASCHGLSLLVILVLNFALQAKITQKSLKTCFQISVSFRVKCWYHWKAGKQCLLLVMVSSKSVFISRANNLYFTCLPSCNLSSSVLWVCVC